MTSTLREKVVRRARRVFAELDADVRAEPEQHKLRFVSLTKLEYNWKGDDGIGHVTVRRDKIGRCYVTELA